MFVDAVSTIGSDELVCRFRTWCRKIGVTVCGYVCEGFGAGHGIDEVWIGVCCCVENDRVAGAGDLGH